MRVCIVECNYEDKTIVSDWFEVTEEELALLRYKYLLLVDLGKEHYIKEANKMKLVVEKQREAQAAKVAKREREKEDKALERKRKQLEKLKKELEQEQ